MARALMVLLVLAVIAFLFLLMRNSWNRRIESGSDIPTLALVPVPFEVAIVVDQATYLGTVSEAHWLDKVAAQGLGSRGPAAIEWGPAGLAIDRVGTGTLFIPTSAMVQVSLERGLAGRVYGPDGVLCVRWTWGPRALTTGLRIPNAEARQALQAQLTESLGNSRGAGTGTNGAAQQPHGEASA